jgi:hypothetical protein
VNIATLVRDLAWGTKTALYRLDPPVVALGEIVTHVIVSTVPKVDGQHGSLVFAANADGTVRSWWTIHRSEHDEHEHALAELGYEVVTP